MAVAKNWNENWKNKAKENQEKAFEIVHLTEEAYVEKPEKIIDFLKTASQFYQYSINNLKLIYAQNPDASCVQSFEAWKKLGYSVLRGQKGIKIFVPVRTTLLKLDDGEIVSLSEATPEQKRMYEHGEIEGYKKTSYKIGNVFDIKQTNVPMENYYEFFVMKDDELSVFLEKLINTFNLDSKGEDGFKEICKYIMTKHFLGKEISFAEKEQFVNKYQEYIGEKTYEQKQLIENLDTLFTECTEQFKKILYEDNLKERGLMTYSEMAAYAKDEVNSKQQKDISTKEHKNYLMLKELAGDILDGTVEYVKFSAGDGFDKLTIEKIGPNRIAMGHYFELNGDLMADPDMEFEIDYKNETMSALSFQNDSMQYYQHVELENGNINRSLQNELNDFTKTWLKNIKEQGYKQVVEQEQIEESLNEQVLYEEKRMLVKDDIIEYEGKKWRITENYNNFMISAENLDPIDKNPSFQWIGNIEEHDYKIIKGIKKTVVALESTEDFADPSHGFYTHNYSDGREGVRYRLVTISENGYLKPYLSENHFFITKELAEEYIQKHEAEIDIISYDEIVHMADKSINSTHKQEQDSLFFEVLECMEFPTMAMTYSDLNTVAEAFEQYKNIEEAKKNLGPGIQLIVNSEKERIEIPLSSGRNIDLDMFQYYPILEENENAKKMVQEFLKEAKANEFQTYGSCTFLDAGQEELGRRRRR